MSMEEGVFCCKGWGALGEISASVWGCWVSVGFVQPAWKRLHLPSPTRDSGLNFSLLPLKGKLASLLLSTMGHDFLAACEKIISGSTECGVTVGSAPSSSSPRPFSSLSFSLRKSLCPCVYRQGKAPHWAGPGLDFVPQGLPGSSCLPFPS